MTDDSSDVMEMIPKDRLKLRLIHIVPTEEMRSLRVLVENSKSSIALLETSISMPTPCTKTPCCMQMRECKDTPYTRKQQNNKRTEYPMLAPEH
jgi:hypothetical protein